jgi:hypothetical protein
MKNKTKNKITWTFSGVDKTYPIASAMSCGCKIGTLFSIACPLFTESGIQCGHLTDDQPGTQTLQNTIKSATPLDKPTVILILEPK